MKIHAILGGAAFVAGAITAFQYGAQIREAIYAAAPMSQAASPAANEIPRVPARDFGKQTARDESAYRFPSILGSQKVQYVAQLRREDLQRLALGVGRVEIILEGREDSFRCTGSLISEQYVLTAGHCITGEPRAFDCATPLPRIARAILWIGDLRQNDDGDGVAVALDPNPADTSWRHDCDRSGSEPLDYALFAVTDGALASARRWNSGVNPLRMGDVHLEKGQALLVLHHPGEQESLIATTTDCVVAETSDDTRIRHICDTWGGSSGAPIIAEDNGVLIGVHNGNSGLLGDEGFAAGAYNFGTRIAAIVADSDKLRTSGLLDRNPPTVEERFLLAEVQEGAAAADRRLEDAETEGAVSALLVPMKALAESPSKDNLFAHLTDYPAPFPLLTEALDRAPLELVLTGVSAKLRTAESVAFSPSGDRVVVGYSDGQIRIWDSRTGGLVKLIGPEKSQTRCSGILAVTFQMDGRRLLAACRNGIMQWDAETGGAICGWDEGSCLLVASGTARAEAAAFNRDGNRTAVAYDDGVIAVWDVSSGRRISEFASGGSYVKAIEFAASDDAVLIGVQISGESENSQARLLRISDGRKVATLDGRKDDEIQGVAMDCGGENFAVAANAASTVIGRRSSGRRQSLRTPGRESRYRRAEIDVTRLAYSPDGRILVTGSRSGIVTAWDSDSSTLFSRLEADPETLSKITALDFEKLPANECGGALRESYRLGVGYNDGTVRIFRIKTSDRAGVRYAHPKEVYSVAFGPEGLLATASDDGAARIFSATASDLTPICQYRTGQRTAPQSIAFSQDGRRLAIGAKFGDIYMLNAEQCASGGALGLEKAWTADSGANVSGLAFSPISPLLATGSQGGLVQLWAGPEYRGAWKAKLDKRVTSVTFDRSGARLAVGSCDSTATVWRLAGADGERADMVASYLHTQPVTSVAFSVGGELLLTGSLDGDARLWDLSQPAGEAQPVLLKGRPCQAEQSAQESIDCPGGPCPVRSVAFNPTRPQLATASQDGSAWLWEISKTSPTSAFPIFVYRGHAKPVNALAFNREGDRLATASQDGSAAVLGVWPLSAEDTLAYAEISRETRIAPRGGPSVQYRAAPQTPDGPPCPSEPEDVLAVDSAACASTIYPALENDERSCRADASHCERALRSYAITTCYFEKIGKTDEARRTRHRRASLARLLPMERSAQVWRDLASRFRAVGCGD